MEMTTETRGSDYKHQFSFPRCRVKDCDLIKLKEERNLSHRFTVMPVILSETKEGKIFSG